MTELAKIENVTAVKQANDDLDQARHIVELGLDLYAGRRQHDLPVPRARRRRRRLRPHARRRPAGEARWCGLQGRRRGGRAADRRGDRAGRTSCSRSRRNPIAIKAALNLLGHEVGGHRLPLVPATDDEIARVRDCLERSACRFRPRRRLRRPRAASRRRARLVVRGTSARARDHFRTELAAGMGTQLLHRRRDRAGRAVGAVARQRVEGVRDEHDPRRQRDLVAGSPSG